MKQKHIVTTASCIMAASALYFCLRQPSEWSGVKVGLSQDEIGTIIPDFDGIWNGDEVATKTKKSLGFVWRLTFKRGKSEIIAVSREFSLDWPQTITLWSSHSIGAETTTVN